MNKDYDIINVHITKDTKGSIYTIKDALHHSSIETSKHYISGKEQRIDKAAEAAGVFFQ